MIKIKELAFAIYYYDRDNSVLIEEWHNKDEKMDNQSFKDTIIHFRDFINEYQILNALVDTRQFAFIVTPETQQWMTNEVMLNIRHKMNKMAFLLPSDIFEQVSIEQTVEEHSIFRTHKEKKNFEDFDLAYKWIIQK